MTNFALEKRKKTPKLVLKLVKISKITIFSENKAFSALKSIKLTKFDGNFSMFRAKECCKKLDLT